MDDINLNFDRDFLCYLRIVAKLDKYDIKFLGVDGHTVGLEKDGRKINQNLATWQAAADPETLITEEMVIDWIINGFNNK